VWGFQRLDLKCTGVSTFKDVTCIEIVEEYGLIAVSGNNGCCHLWQYDFIDKEDPTLTCLCRLGEVDLSTHGVTGLSRLMGSRQRDAEKEKQEEEAAAEKMRKKKAEEETAKPKRKQRMTRNTIRYEAQLKQTEEEAMAAESVDGYLVATDDRGHIKVFDLDAVLASLPHICLIDDHHFPCNDPDYMAELKLSRDMRIYLSSKAPELDESDLDVFKPAFSWGGHEGSVVKSMCIENPPSIVTASNDGFVCAWNVHGTLLGEMRLPNVDEHKKFLRKQRNLPVKEVDWNFPQERHEVSAEHVRKARELIAVQDKRQEKRMSSLKSGSNKGRTGASLWDSVRNEVTNVARLKQVSADGEPRAKRARRRVKAASRERSERQEELGLLTRERRERQPNYLLLFRYDLLLVRSLRSQSCPTTSFSCARSGFSPDPPPPPSSVDHAVGLRCELHREAWRRENTGEEQAAGCRDDRRGYRCRGRKVLRAVGHPSTD
jgi:hypothetical protein